MPIFEYRCLNCHELFEKLVMGADGNDAVACPKCAGTAAERVMSTTNYSMPGGGGASPGTAGAQTRTCSGGSCTTYNIPGPK